MSEMSALPPQGGPPTATKAKATGTPLPKKAEATSDPVDEEAAAADADADDGADGFNVQSITRRKPPASEDDDKGDGDDGDDDDGDDVPAAPYAVRTGAAASASSPPIPAPAPTSASASASASKSVLSSPPSATTSARFKIMSGRVDVPDVDLVLMLTPKGPDADFSPPLTAAAKHIGTDDDADLFLIDSRNNSRGVSPEIRSAPDMTSAPDLTNAVPLAATDSAIGPDPMVLAGMLREQAKDMVVCRSPLVVRRSLPTRPRALPVSSMSPIEPLRVGSAKSTFDLADVRQISPSLLPARILPGRRLGGPQPAVAPKFDFGKLDQRHRSPASAATAADTALALSSDWLLGEAVAVGRKSPLVSVSPTLVLGAEWDDDDDAAASSPVIDHFTVDVQATPIMMSRRAHKIMSNLGSLPAIDDLDPEEPEFTPPKTTFTMETDESAEALATTATAPATVAATVVALTESPPAAPAAPTAKEEALAVPAASSIQDAATDATALVSDEPTRATKNDYGVAPVAAVRTDTDADSAIAAAAPEAVAVHTKTKKEKKKGHKKKGHKRKKSKGSGDGSSSHLRVLVVDDNPMARKLMRFLMKRMKITCEFAENGQVAVDKVITDNSFDLVIMDKEMPVMNGHEAARDIRSRGIDIPILGVTAHEHIDQKKEFVDAGVDEVLTKPVRMKSLKKAIKSATALPSGKKSDHVGRPKRML